MRTVSLRFPGGLDQIVLGESADPGAPGPGQIRVVIKAGTINYHDLLVALGAIPTADGRVLLSDGAGVVEAVGAGVDEFQVGDHVVSTFFPLWEKGSPPASAAGFSATPGDGIDGMASEVVVRAASAFTHAPRGWSHLQAATITTSGLTAWRALAVNGQLKAGDSVLLQGTGGVSIAALQLAKGMGARVIITSSSNAKLARARELGADELINYREQPEWGAAVLELTNGEGVDHVVEVGGPSTLAQSLEALKVGGHVALIGLLSGTEAKLPLFSALTRHARLQAVLVGSRQHQQDYVRALEQIAAPPVIDRVFPYAELVDAFAHMQDGAHFGKIGVEW